MYKCHFLLLKPSYKYEQTFINKDILEVYEYKFVEHMANLINLALTSRLPME